MTFSQGKFLKLPTKRKIKWLLRMIEKLEDNFEDEDKRILHTEELASCLSVIEDSKEKDLQLFSPLNKLLQKSFTLDQLLVETHPLPIQLLPALKDHQLEIRKYDGSPKKHAPIKVTAILHNLRSAYNVGAIFRSAECVQIKEIILTGYTPTPENIRAKRTAMGTDELISWRHEDELDVILQQFKENNYPIYALETVKDAPSVFEVEYPKNPFALLVGNETEGIAEETLKVCDHVIQIPVFGKKNSLNVATAFSVAAFTMGEQIRNL